MVMKIIGIKEIHSEKKGDFVVLYTVREKKGVNGLYAEEIFLDRQSFPSGIAVNDDADFQFDSDGRLDSINKLK